LHTKTNVRIIKFIVARENPPSPAQIRFFRLLAGAHASPRFCAPFLRFSRVLTQVTVNTSKRNSVTRIFEQKLQIKKNTHVFPRQSALPPLFFLSFSRSLFSIRIVDNSPHLSLSMFSDRFFFLCAIALLKNLLQSRLPDEFPSGTVCCTPPPGAPVPRLAFTTLRSQNFSDRTPISFAY